MLVQFLWEQRKEKCSIFLPMCLVYSTESAWRLTLRSSISSAGRARWDLTVNPVLGLIPRLRGFGSRLGGFESCWKERTVVAYGCPKVVQSWRRSVLGENIGEHPSTAWWGRGGTFDPCFSLWKETPSPCWCTEQCLQQRWRLALLFLHSPNPSSDPPRGSGSLISFVPALLLLGQSFVKRGRLMQTLCRSHSAGKINI